MSTRVDMACAGAKDKDPSHHLHMLQVPLQEASQLGPLDAGQQQ
jgi:hypothetical protein